MNEVWRPRYCEAATKEALARAFGSWEVWSPDERLIGSGAAADDMIDWWSFDKRAKGVLCEQGTTTPHPMRTNSIVGRRQSP